MKKRQILVLIGALLIILVFGATYYFAKQPSDRCTPMDKARNNCVPAGRCTPPGDPREATIDCEIKSYDHTFSS